jgi:hypothetical protein
MKDSLLGGANHLVAPLIKHVPLDQIETWPEATKALTLEDVNGVLKTTLDPTYYVTGYLLPEKGDEASLENEAVSENPQKNPEPEELEKISEDKGVKKDAVPIEVFKKTPPSKNPPVKKPSLKKASPLKAEKTVQKKGIKHA